MASHVSTVRIQEHTVSIDDLYEDTFEKNFEGERGSQHAAKEVYTTNFIKFTLRYL